MVVEIQNLRTPSPVHALDDHVFTVGENEIIHIEERTTSGNKPGNIVSYVVSFKDATPTRETVQSAIELMRIFKDISWDFQLLADMRPARLISQLRYVASYSKLIGLIENIHCKHCFVFVDELPPIIGTLLTSTVERIVSALSVPCTIVHLATPITSPR